MGPLLGGYQKWLSCNLCLHQLRMEVYRCDHLRWRPNSMTLAMMLTLCVCECTYVLVPNTSISVRYKSRADVMLILRYLPHASVVKFTTTGVLSASLTIENTVLSVLLERRSELWTERLRAGILLRNVITRLPTHHPWGMSSTTKGLVLPLHPYNPLALTE